MQLFEAWGEVDRSHRKLAHRGSRTGLVHVSESTVARVLAAEGLVIEGPPPREPLPRAPWPDWLEWKPSRVWACDFTHWTRAGRASIAILDLVSRKWLATLTSAEETSTQVEACFLAALDAEDLLDQAGQRASAAPLLATSLYEDPSAGMHEDASARLREHPAPVGCSILRRPSPPCSVSGHRGSRCRPRGGHRAHHRGRPDFRGTALRVSCLPNTGRSASRTGPCVGCTQISQFWAAWYPPRIRSAGSQARGAGRAAWRVKERCPGHEIPGGNSDAMVTAWRVASHG